MAKKRVDPNGRGAGKPNKVPSALADLLAQLDRMKQDPTASEVRLRSDLARDSAEELFVTSNGAATALAPWSPMNCSNWWRCRG